jgi:hypothetical protein
MMPLLRLCSPRKASLGEGTLCRQKVLELAKGFEVDPVPGERVYAFLGTVVLTIQPELPEVES